MSAEKQGAEFQFTVAAAEQGQRLDVFLATHVETMSRSQVQRAINDGLATSGGDVLKPSARLQPGQTIRFLSPPPPPAGVLGEDIPLDILFEDDQVIVVNKPPGMVVHPSTGHWQGTLASALVYRFEQLSDSGGSHRPGIIHRLDRDTSGCIIVARNNRAHAHIAAQFAARTVNKSYLAIVTGTPEKDRDIINKPIGMHPRQREKMAVRADHSTSRDAESFYEVLDRFKGHSLLRIQPKTGRTHQVRVHLSFIGHPVLCDTMYGSLSSVRGRDIRPGLQETDDSVILARQALHAASITFSHPVTEKPLSIEAPLPSDLQAVLDLLRG
jgi:23S rRNA pseudouridine1911/1915/1917 synthase